MVDNSEAKGHLTVYLGPMGSGKTTRLANFVNTVDGPYTCLKPRKDDRYGITPQIISHSDQDTGDQVTAFAQLFDSRDPDEILWFVEGLSSGASVVIDEIQFAVEGVIPVIDNLLGQGFHVVVAGLDYDSAGQPFGATLKLAEMAQEVHKLKGKCGNCGGESTLTIATVKKDGQVLVGGFGQYMPVCEECFKTQSVQ